MKTSSVAIALRNVEKVYRSHDMLVHALNGIDLDISMGAQVAIVGASGSGKSTLIHLIAGLERPSRGQIFVFDQPVHRLHEDALSLFRQHNIGFIFQDYQLLGTMTALENVAIPLMLTKVPKKQRLYEAEALLDTFGLYDLSRHFPSELSGGQQQRVAIARALIAHPKLILADEPTGNLDSAAAQLVMEQLERYVRTRHSTLLMVTHDLDTARRAELIIRLYRGALADDKPIPGR